MAGAETARGPAKVVAVVTTYFPDESLRKTIAAVLPQVSGVVLVDDSGEPRVNELVRDYIRNTPEVTLLCNEENLGLAKTLNRGIESAIRMGAAFVLTLDDDSVLPPEYLRTAVLAIDECSRQLGRTVGALRVTTWKRPRSVGPTPTNCRHKRGVITSGMVVPIGPLSVVGGYREELVIDGLDYDLCIRLRKAGFCVLEAWGDSPRHRLGNATTHTWLGRSIVTTNHAAVRRYYQSRNWITLGMEQALADPAYCAASMWFVAKTVFKVAALENGRPTKLRAMSLGAWDAVRGRLGPCPADRRLERSGSGVRRAK